MTPVRFRGGPLRGKRLPWPDDAVKIEVVDGPPGEYRRFGAYALWDDARWTRRRLLPLADIAVTVALYWLLLH